MMVVCCDVAIHRGFSLNVNDIMVGDWKALCCCSSVFECCLCLVEHTARNILITTDPSFYIRSGHGFPAWSSIELGQGVR